MQWTHYKNCHNWSIYALSQHTTHRHITCTHGICFHSYLVIHPPCGSLFPTKAQKNFILKAYYLKERYTKGKILYSTSTASYQPCPLKASSFVGGLVEKSVLSLVTQNCEAKLNFHTRRMGLSASTRNRTSVWARAPEDEEVSWCCLVSSNSAAWRQAVLAGAPRTRMDILCDTKIKNKIKKKKNHYHHHHQKPMQWAPSRLKEDQLETEEDIHDAR